MKTIRTLLLGLLCACTYEDIPPIVIPAPPTSDETQDLIAEYVSFSPNSINHGYWTTADFRAVQVADLITGEISEEDGLLNNNGTLDGIASFNDGEDPGFTLKAAYNDEFLYILASWSDPTVDGGRASWLYNGPSDPNDLDQDSSGWTSQWADDKLVLGFDVTANSRDVWTWSLALSEPLGYAIDQFEDQGTLENDDGDWTFVRNVAGTGNRAGPMYEWNGEIQELTRASGGLTILDPGFFLLNKTEFVGDILAGDDVYIRECEECHGVGGDGDGSFGVSLPLNTPGGLNRLSREAFGNLAGDPNHSGQIHWTVLDDTEKEDLVARIRGISGVPGYYLENPGGSASDVLAVSSLNLARLSTRSNNPGYTVLMIRALNTGNADDIVFDPTTEGYSFDVAVMNADNLNQVGEVGVQLIFKSPN